MATVTGYTAAKIDQLIAGVSGSSGVELVSGVVDLDGTGSPVREFYCTASATIEGVAFAAGTTVVFRRTPADVWGYIVVDSWITAGATTTTTTTTAATTTTTTTTAATTTTTTTTGHLVLHTFSTAGGQPVQAANTGQTWLGINYAFVVEEVSLVYKCRSVYPGNNQGGVLTGVSDFSASLDVYNPSGGAFMVRASFESDAMSTNFLSFSLQADGTCSLKDAATNTSIATGTIGGVTTPGTKYTLRADCLGTSVKCYVNNSLVMDATTSAHLTRTGVGIYQYGTSTARYDNLIVDAL